jgi:branched-chain amino acid transport system ATP-binding protein
MSAERSAQPLLRAAGLSVHYGGVCANDAIDLHVGAGEIVGLIGPNGAGKTTFIDAVSGFTPCSSGEVWVGETRVDGMPAHRRRKVGLARTWQSGELFSDLTVGENLSVAARTVGLRMLGSDLLRLGRQRPDPAVARALDAVGLAHEADRRPTDLSLGQQKLVGVARALAGDSRVLLLDEPAAGLGTEESRHFGEQMKRIAATGVSALLVDHDMGLVLEVCDRVYVLDFGTLIASGRPQEIVADEAVVAAYLGSPDPETDAVAS